MERRFKFNFLFRLMVLLTGGALLLNAAPAAAEPAKVVFVLDASGSMWGQIDGKAKIVIAKEVLNNLIDGLPEDMQVGLFAYGHRTKGDCKDIEMLVPVGAIDRKNLKDKIANLNAKGKTPLSEAVRQAAVALRYTEEKASVILVSDGIETCDADPCKLAAELAMSGVDFTVHVIGFDIKEEEQSRLSCLADKTGGLFLAADNAQTLADALTQTVAKTKESPKPVVQDPGTAKLTAAASVPAGSQFEVQWEGPGSRKDFIAIALKDPKDQAYGNYVYTEKGNPARLSAPGKTGDYELRYIHGETGKVIGRTDIKVTPVQAVLKPPASAQAAGEFDVAWEGPDYEGDFITISRPEDIEANYKFYTYTKSGNPARLRAPSDAGAYEIRYVMAADTTVLARAPIAIEGVGAKVEAPESVDIAAEFDVKWEGPNTHGDYISVAAPDDEGGRYEAYTYTKTGNPLKLRAPSEPGQYEVRYIQGQGNNILAQIPIAVKGVAARVEPPASADMATEFEVKWEGPDNKGDYISIAAPGDEDGRYKAYKYTKTGNPVKLRAPSEPGQYEVRYVVGQGNKILARTPIAIEAVAAQVQAPASADMATEFEVNWAGPDNQGDYISIAAPGDEGGRYKAYKYTKTGNPVKLRAPSEPGQYEVRYVVGQGNKILAKAPITINAVTAQVQAPTSADIKAEFEVKWEGPNTQGDYISIAAPGDEGGRYKAYKYTKTGNPVKLRAPSEPGQYEVRYILGQGNKILARARITIKAATN